jgi:hypothetical protein
MVGDEVRQRVKPARIRTILQEYRGGNAAGGNGQGAKAQAAGRGGAATKAAKGAKR